MKTNEFHDAIGRIKIPRIFIIIIIIIINANSGISGARTVEDKTAVTKRS
jgi:hypothetical protein